MELALADLQSRLRRWETALESGALSIEQAAERIKELHEQRHDLLKKKQALDGDRRGVKTISAIPNAKMDAYITALRGRLAETTRRKKGISPRACKGGESARR